MNEHEKINYVEFPARDIAATKAFFATVFGWSFVDYGPEYTAFSNEGLDGGFYQSDNNGFRSEACPLIVFYYYDIDEIKDKVIALSGTIVKDTFSFPGGRRFHFGDPNGNEYAVWSDIN